MKYFRHVSTLHHHHPLSTFSFNCLGNIAKVTIVHCNFVTLESHDSKKVMPRVSFYRIQQCIAMVLKFSPRYFGWMYSWSMLLLAMAWLGFITIGSLMLLESGQRSTARVLDAAFLARIDFDEAHCAATEQHRWYFSNHTQLSPHGGQQNRGVA